MLEYWFLFIKNFWFVILIFQISHWFGYFLLHYPKIFLWYQILLVQAKVIHIILIGTNHYLSLFVCLLSLQYLWGIQISRITLLCIYIIISLTILVLLLVFQLQCLFLLFVEYYLTFLDFVKLWSLNKFIFRF